MRSTSDEPTISWTRTIPYQLEIEILELFVWKLLLGDLIKFDKKIYNIIKKSLYLVSFAQMIYSPK